MSGMTEEEIINNLNVLDVKIKSLKSEFEKIKMNLINIETELIGLYVSKAKFIENLRILRNKKGIITK